MLAVCLAQLASEVYDGIEAWENDERDIAYGYLVDVFENVALMAAFSAAAKALKGARGDEAGTAVEGQEVGDGDDEASEIERIPVETPSFIEELEEVETTDGQVRLWKPDLAPYRSTEALPEGLEADALGLRQHDGRHWLVVQGDQYIVEQEAVTGEYRLQHPRDPGRYQPPLRHNGAGAWLLGTDRPLSWSGMQLLRRIGHLNAYFDEATLQRIVAISGSDEDQLRRALATNQRLPALLEDTLQRFRLDDTLRLLPDTRSAEFHRAYTALPIALAPGAEALLRVSPQLPAVVANELARAASTTELQMLGNGKMPLRLNEEIRVYRQQIRLARAYEGLYLSCVPNWDSDRLVVHTLAQLPDWPAETRVRLLQRWAWPAQDYELGPLGGLPYKTITHAEAGYIVHDNGPSNAVPSVYPSLYAALYEALPVAMTTMGISDQQALERLVQESPLLPRPALRMLLGMQPVRPGYRSPCAWPMAAWATRSVVAARPHKASPASACSKPSRPRGWPHTLAARQSRFCWRFPAPAVHRCRFSNICRH